jgi:hypothetical protein
MAKHQTLDEMMAEYESERLAQLAKDQADYDRPENVAKRKAKTESEHERGVRLGWWKEDGSPIEQPDQIEDEDEDDAEEDDND